MARKIRTVPIGPVTPYRSGARYLVMPADLHGDFAVCRTLVENLEGDGAWLTLREDSPDFPNVEEVLLVEFQSDSVLTHRTRIMRREAQRVWVDCPSLSRRSKNQMLPAGARRDFRVASQLPVVILLRGEEFAQALPRQGRLNDVSRGGMGLVVPVQDIYVRGQSIEVQVVSWAHAVSVECTVQRIWLEGERKFLALKFPHDLGLEQRERITAFVLHVQRQASLENTLPAIVDGDT
ncbi:MAG: PilZ domain-containing protein [Candidatus Eremiobacteraeota bacterium]|nr:PilZ domain-containing protein [Candidatus Eremiobacteraeota bacterium]